MSVDLTRVSRRDKLEARREPHWQRLQAGRFLGYRPSLTGGDGSWIARIYNPDTQSYQTKSLGDFGSLPKGDRFTAAKCEAETFANQIETGGYTQQQLVTVDDACRAYAETRPDAQGRFRRYVYDHSIAKVKLDRLRYHHLKDWRQALEQRPALISRSKGGQAETRPRSPATINRDMAALRAALNAVLPHGKPKTPGAWQEALVAIPNASKRRTLYLDREQRRRLLDHVGDEAYNFVRALCLLPIRPGAMAKLSVGSFDTRTSELTIGQDKHGQDRRIILPEETAGFFARLVQDRPSSQPLFHRDAGQAWDRDSWKGPIKRAALDAGLPKETSAYTLRHSTITDLVKAKLPLLTIAQISGTSAAMIEKHYGHLARDAAVDALGTLTL